MATAFTYKITGARVEDQGQLLDAIKELDLEVFGADGAAKFSLPATVRLSDADPDNFVDFESLTEAQIVSWVSTAEQLDAVRAHIAYVVSKEAEKLAMQSKPLPWAPVTTEPADPNLAA